MNFTQATNTHQGQFVVGAETSSLHCIGTWTTDRTYQKERSVRKDDEGNDCPATLGEYRDLCAALGGESSQAVKLLDRKIASEGRDAEVIAADSQMRALLMPLLFR